MVNNHNDIILEVVSKYWQQEKTISTRALEKIVYLRKDKKKIVGILPKYNDKPSVIFKIYLDQTGYDNEINAYKAVNIIEPIGNISVPNLIAIFPEQQTLLIEKLDFRRSDDFSTSFFNYSKKVNWCHIAQWLKKFHATKNNKIINDSFLQNKYHRANQLLERMQNILPDESIRLFEEIIRLSKEYLKTFEVEWVFSHGDFGTGNILLSDTKVYIYDFEWTTMAPKDYEVITFLAGLKSSLFFIFRKKAFRQFRNAFLEGYNSIIETNPLNELFYLLSLLEKISAYHKRKLRSNFIPLRILYYLVEWIIIQETNRWLDHPNSLRSVI